MCCPIMPNIRDLPNELLPWIVSHLDGSAIFALAKSCKDLDVRLQPSIWKYNIKVQNSNLLHLTYNANINAFYRGKTPLMRALKYSSAAVHVLLLDHRDLDINIQNQACDSALSVDVKHKHGRTALHLAVFAGKIGFVHLLLSNGSDPDLEDDSCHSPRAWARHFNRLAMKMIFFNDPDSELLLAISHGWVDAVKRLLRRKGLNLDIQDRKSYTPLHLAVQSRRLEVVDVILSHSHASVDCKDKHGNTLLWLSTYSSCDEITERLLAEKDINVNFVGGRGKVETPSTSLHHAATRLDTVLLRRLLAVPRARSESLMEGVEINGRAVIDSPICQAVSHGHLDVVRLLVQQGARLNINESTIATHDTALCIAARGGDLEMVQALLRHNQIDVNLRNRWSEHPLMLAVKGGHVSIVDALVVNPSLKYFSLKRSLDIARNDCIQRAIQSRMEDDNTRQTLLMRSPRREFGGL
ncbi:unnamed protein product [Penicillium salamii]|uniref:F-box domain-containing protein n=1 Tax=Penicillium salamii TaxID=1612424 RepID=A0A9W4NH30_9EURO|nr:unnamed protein product [Penicillium salamii]CAG8055880.1 unnamed protein product [Penicillium salamii]CAG8057414.1 unnamed protein product [Penicillium salamii]CAG8082224.1 unnamed protein product [Penicillium salamii]CAG8089340.1 unnamed protein product [Penicillium salamii]